MLLKRSELVARDKKDSFLGGVLVSFNRLIRCYRMQQGMAGRAVC